MTEEAAVPRAREPKFGNLGYITYKRTYARPIRNGGSEEFSDTVERVVKACREQLDCGFDVATEDRLRDVLYDMRGSVAGRFLWQLGTSTVDKLGLASLQNCACVVVNHPIRPFTWAMDMLMLGCGVGYNIQREYVYELPKPRRVRITRMDTNDADYIVPDSREGWVSLLEQVLDAHFHTGRNLSYSTICIRGKGAPIRGFGGVASGPEELAWGIQEISRVLNERAGKKLRPIDCLDIMNIIGYVVVAGNVRRSAQIAIGDCDDLQFLSAKRWDLGTIPRWRAMSNNSVVCNDITKLPQQFWDAYQGGGEPYGLINLRLTRSVGRLGEFQYPDMDVCGFNPCCEQPLAAYETCCLAEIFLPRISSAVELYETAEVLYKICKHSLRLDCHHEETQNIVHKNMRMGIGITGYLQATTEQKSWLSDTYRRLRLLDETYSQEKNWPRSVKLTTVKPSGTLSLLPGVTPGVHPAYSQYYIRRIRISSNSALVDVCRSNGYPIEPQKNLDGTIDPNTMVVSFPCSYPDGTVCAGDVSAIQQLEYVRELQTGWSDNAVSCTIYYRKEELPAIREWLAANYNNNCKSLSFLLHSEHGFLQSPYEEITKEQYLQMAATVRPIISCEISESTVDLGMDCETGACPVK